LLFNSPQFLFLFLPIVLSVFFLLGQSRVNRWAAAWAAVASLYFYGVDSPAKLLPIISVSIVFNYIVGRLLFERRSRVILSAGITCNLLLLAWFKYAGFIAGNVASLGFSLDLPSIILPIGISFYTFTQIAFLVDTYRGLASEYRFVHYVLFVTYFPHLIAGPILHHKEVMPQFAKLEVYRFNISSFSLGISWFAFGLFKKVVLADSIGAQANVVFDAIRTGASASPSDGWLGAVSYGLQIYFDFSGYSDMAIGLALMMGIVFPLNFYSPYKSSSMIEFWRRWHMTLSRFLRDYLYIPLGGSRNGYVRQHFNLLVTMTLGGLWHGASWNFVIWGVIHGGALSLNHLWRGVAPRLGLQLPAIIGAFLTMFVVIVAWVPFRAATLDDTGHFWRVMFGFGGDGFVVGGVSEWTLAATLGAISILLPNTAQIFRHSGHSSVICWRPRPGWAVITGFALAWGIAWSISQPTAFLYFRF
jgi:alginate O-acetyltransferase complex protein AlgI